MEPATAALNERKRELKGLEIAKAIGRRNDASVAIQRMNKMTYKVRSQSDPSKWYMVIRQHGSNETDHHVGAKWTCDCPDYTFRNIQCKHVHAVVFSKLLRKKVYQDTLLQTPIDQTVIAANELGKVVCQRCGSENYKKDGIRHNKKNEPMQRYLCRDCGFRFIVNPAFENAKASARIISAAIDLYMKGVSLRKIEDHVQQAYNVKVSDSSVCRWIRKFNKTVQPYVDSFVPQQVGGVYHVDEMLLHVRGEDNDMNMTLDNKENHTHRFFDNHYSWLWNLMDSTTRFWICSRISQNRSAKVARDVFADMKKRAPMPKAVVHDGLRSYDDAFQDSLFTFRNPRIQNIRSIGSNEKGLNPKVERLNGTVRDRESVMRGMDTAESAQELIDAMRIHYNFIRPNQAIGGQTPAEAVGINLNLRENKTENLMRLAALYRKEAAVEPAVKGLGDRASNVRILNERDCVKVKPKMWLEREKWVEINDILRVQGFGWLPKGRDSCWIKMIQ